jgi:hypothetical protein
MFHTKVVDKIKTRRFMFSNVFPKMEIINHLCLLSIKYFEVFCSSHSYINKYLLVVKLKGVMSLFSFSLPFIQNSV